MLNGLVEEHREWHGALSAELHDKVDKKDFDYAIADLRGKHQYVEQLVQATSAMANMTFYKVVQHSVQICGDEPYLYGCFLEPPMLGDVANQRINDAKAKLFTHLEPQMLQRF